MDNSSKFLKLDPPDTLAFNGEYGTECKTTLTIFNSSDTNVYFQIKVTYPKHYTVSSSSGIIGAFESRRIQITAKELSPDCEKHKFNVLSAVQNINLDANTFWKTIEPGKYSSKKLTVQINPNEQQTFNKQQLELYIRQAVQQGESLFATHIQLFSDPNIVPKAVQQFVTKEYTDYLIEVLKHNFKSAVLHMIQNGDASAIQNFRENRGTFTIQSPLWNHVFTQKQQIQLSNFCSVSETSGDALDRAGQPIITSAKKYFDMCLRLYVDEEAETAIRQLLVEWFKSGHMNKAVFDIWKSFKDEEISPTMLQNIHWQDLTVDDHYAKQFEQILQRMRTDKFLHTAELYNILNIFVFEEPSFNTPKDSSDMRVLVVNGRVVFLSDIKDQIEKQIQKNKQISEVRFYAKNVFNIDESLENQQWHGKNVVIVADKVHVWESCTIDVSGSGCDHSGGKKRTRDGRAYGEKGEQGKDGTAGESSGNIIFLAEELLEGELLTLKLNGGNGQHGEDGGNGANGKDGCGVSRNDLDSLILSYTTLYWGSSNHFFNFTPKNSTEIERKVDNYNKYVSAKFKDANGRMMYWSYAEDYSYWSASMYDLYFLIKGTQGTAGGIGGSNGVGGEGGNRGECTARKLYSGKELSIGKIQQNAGCSGVHGNLGKAGHFGKSGNDMVFVDRSTISSGKKYIGSSGTMCIDFQFQMTQSDSRIDGYEKWVTKRSSYYVHFTLKEVPEGTIMKMETQQKTDANRKTKSKAVCKASIIVSDVVNEFAECFQQDDAVLDEACRAQERADAEEHNEDEEQEQETVAEEMNVLLDCADENNSMSGVHGAEKKRSDWTKFAKELKKYDKQNNANTIELAFQLFEHEATEAQLNEDNDKIDQVVNDLKNAAQHEKWKNSKYSFLQIQTLAKTIGNKLKQKRAQAALRSQKSVLFGKYLSSIGKAKNDLDVSMSTLIGVKPGREYTCQYKARVISDFFRKYQTLGVSAELLDAMYGAFVYLERKHKADLALFDAGMDFDWNDENAVKVQLNEAETAAVTTSSTTNDKRKSVAETSPLDKLEKALKTEIQDLEAVFENFNEIIKADKTKALLKRFGLMPTSKIEKEEIKEAKQMDLEETVQTLDAYPDQPTEKSKGWFSNWRDHMPNYFNSKHGTTCFVVKFYFQTRTILAFNQRLYICNALSNAELLHPDTNQILSNNLHNINQPDFTAFMEERKRQPLNVQSGQCEDFVSTHGIDAAAYRFLFAYEFNVNVRIYKPKRYETIELQENVNPSASQKVMLLSNNGKMYSIDSDIDYRSMVAARKELVNESNVSLPKASTSSELLTIANFFPKEYVPIVSSWLRMFHAVNKPRALVFLSLLYQHFQLDGCQLSLVELQAILNAYSHATVICHTNDDFLVQIAAVMSQHQILDVLLYVRIENALKRRLDRNQGNEIANAIQSVDSPHLKALFATKLNEAGFDENILLKLLVMLRYAVDRFQRLENMTLKEWIDTSQRQKWSAIGELLREYGAVGYYLAFLDNRNRPEEPMLRKCLQEISSTRVLIPEKVIARVAYLIAYGEVNADRTYLSRLKQLFEVISENYSHYLPPEQQNDAGMQLSGYPLLMNERNQNDLLAQVKKHHNEKYEPIFPTGERTVDMLKTLIVGQHDNEQRKSQRKLEIIDLAAKLNSKQCENARIINEIDAVIAKVFQKPKGPKMGLRDTQKMAVLIAAESEKNTLLQVNTGEGKTLLIATLAILRAKQNKKVDVITSSPVLAARDVEKMQPLFKAFHIKASHNCEEQLDARKLAYKSQIVYGDMQHFQRDFLLHNFYKKNILGDRTRQCVIVDEVDNMLLDNGNNMLYLSHNVAGMEALMSLFVFLHRAVNVPLYGEQQTTQFDSATIRKQVLGDMFGYVDKQSLEKLRPNMKTDVNRVWQKLIERNIMDRDGLLYTQSQKELPNNFLQILEAIVTKTLAIQVKDYICVILHRERFIQIPRYLHSFVLRHLDEFIENTKRAMFMRYNDEYVVDIDHKNASADLNPRITIIDKNTGVDLTTSQWSEGLHQAVQLKHGCHLSPISLKAIFVSNVGYFKGYEQINGLSGTLGSIEESKTLVALYRADLVRIPTWKPKNFYEHVPLVAANEAVWLQNIYEEVKDQVIAQRSVLIVCNSISQVDAVRHGLERLHRLEKHAVLGKSRFAQLVRKHVMKGASWKRVFVNKLMTDCFEKLIVYRRDHDQFDLSGVNALAKGRTIIATNLAGRGTDIELSDGLQQAGGLHVIVAFLPENCRIEEQAFGRAARCGHPGSGQIIALIEDDKRIDAAETPTIFQLKEFRDNAEVHRLQSLKQRYEYHTAVEESCLNKFWEHCSKALESVQSTKSTTNANILPMPMEVIYFALLDEWALWLDEKAPLIQQCGRSCNDDHKRTIIKTVEEFLTSHPLNNVQTATAWLKSPQPLLTLGLIELNENNPDQAESIFCRVLKEFPEYAAEASYYIGVIQQRRTRQVYGKLSRSTAFELDTWKEWLIGTEKREITAATNAFHESRRQFSLRRFHRDDLATIITRLQRANESIISTNGFADQHREYVAVHDAIIGNIDRFLGKPIEPADLHHEGRDELHAVLMRNTLKELGITTRTVLTSEIYEDQIKFICSRHPISRKELVTKLDGLRKQDDLHFESESRPELETFELRRLFKLPNRLDFWNELRELGVFLEESKYFTTRLSETIEGLTPVNPSIFDEIQVLRLQFTDVPLDSVKVFKLQDIVKVEEENSNRSQLKAMLESGAIATEFVAVVDPNRLLKLAVYMRNFEGFQLEELKDYLNIDIVTAKWIVSTYVQDKIIAPDIDGVYRLIGKQYTNDWLPNALNTAVEKFFADRFAYTHSLDALRSSFIKACETPNISKFIYLPTNPYEDLLADMLKCGIAMPSRVSLAIPRKIDSNYDVAVQAMEHIHDFNKMKDIIELNRPTIADVDCKLVATHKYVIDNGTDPNQELKHFISNGLKQVAIVEEDTTWLWLLGIGAVLLILVAVVAIAVLGWTGIGIGIAVAAIALAAYAIYKVGSYAYYRATRMVVKRTVTIDKTADFEFSVLREFNTVSIDEEIRKKEQNTLLKKVHDGINDLTDKLNNWLIENVKSIISLDEYLSTEATETFSIPLNRFQKRSPKFYDALMKIVPIVVDQSIKSEDVTEEIRFLSQSYIPKVQLELYATLKVELSQKSMQQKPHTIGIALDDLKNKITEVRLETLRKIVETTCKTFEANLEDKTKKFNKYFEQTELSDSSEAGSDSDNDDNSDFDIALTELYSDAGSEKTMLNFISELLVDRYTELISREIFRSFREPLLRRFVAYITNTTAPYKESLISRNALDFDITTKKQNQTFEKIFHAKSQVQFLEHEVQQVCAECWDMRQDTSVLHCMVSNRYPLPISAALSVEKAIRTLLAKAKLYLGEFELILLNEERKTTMYDERGKKDTLTLQLTLTLHGEHFYVARNNSSKGEEIDLLCFLYEGLCGLREQFRLTFHTADEFVAELADSCLRS